VLSSAALAMTLGAAVLHATWNAIAHAVSDRLIGFTLIGIAYTLVCAILVATLGAPPAAIWPFVVASAAAHALYQLFLLVSYQLGEFSQAYPLARGTSPWVVALISITVLGQRLPWTELAAVLVISAGLIALVGLGGPPSTGQLPALGAAFVTGLFISGYTVIDGVAVGRAPVPVYAAWVFLLQGPALPLIALARRRAALPGQLRPVAAVGLAGGVVSLAAYGLVLWAQRISGELAALRETSIVIGALIGAAVFGERLGARRAVAAAVVVAGVALLAVA
jgi:drug/metabolite transporter (DMT)-like permease